MSMWRFDIRYETRTVVIHGEAWVSGNYSDASKPEAMVRASLAEATKPDGNLRVTLVDETSAPADPVVGSLTAGQAWAKRFRPRPCAPPAHK